MTRRSLKPAPPAPDLEALLIAVDADLASRRFGAALEKLMAAGTPGAGEARFQARLGEALRGVGRPKDALEALEAALSLDPQNLRALVFRGLARMDIREPLKALDDFEEVVRRDPARAEHQRLLALAARRAERLDQAGEAFKAAIELAPREPSVWCDFAALLEERNRLEESLATLDRGLVQCGPHKLLVESRLGFLRRRGRHPDAAAWTEALLSANPSVPWLHRQLALTVQGSDRDRANRHFRSACELDPGDRRAVTELAESLNRTRGGDEVESLAEAYALALRRLDLGPLETAEIRPLLGVFLRVADFDAVDRLGPFETMGRRFAENGAETALQLLLSQAKAPRDRRLLIDWHLACGDRFLKSAALRPLPASPAIVGRAKIRIGLMSSDLRDHPVGYFVKPLIEGYDRRRFEIYGYSWLAQRDDAVQRGFAARMDAFRHRPEVGAREAAALIAEDRLDVLFDLGGSTDQNKLAALAWKPAPRIASWLGYAHSAGLRTIDRLLVDPFLEPADSALMVEAPLRLARSWVAFVRPELEPMFPITPSTPEARQGFLTFGTMNNTVKFNRELVAAWAEILRAAPGSRFLFVRPESALAAFREQMAARFEAAGVGRERVLFAPVRGRHLPYYNLIDVALDTFPLTGGTTTCEALWMGVPTVSLVGEGFFERLSYSNLSNAGLGDLAVFSRADYTRAALALAADPERRAELRRTMRERLKSHPLGDGEGFVRDFQNAVTDWREGRG